MQAGREQSVEELRRESERSRAELAATVGKLREKVGDTTAEIKAAVSPAHIKQGFRTYIREERDSIVGSLEQKARDNPLQAAAIGAALAYPALGLMRAIPMPLLLIGAGLWLTGKSGRRAIAQTKSRAADAYDRATAGNGAPRTDEGHETAGGFTAAAASMTDSAMGQVRRTAHDLRDTVTSTVSGVADATSARAADFADRASAGASQIKSGAKTSGSAIADFVNQNPLLVAGIGAAAGAVIAASLPASAAENRLFGDASSDLKRKARDAASDGLDKAKAAAALAATDLAASAAREGLGPDGLKKAADTVVEGVKAVAERGMAAALGGYNDDRETPRPEKAASQNKARMTGATDE